MNSTLKRENYTRIPNVLTSLVVVIVTVIIIMVVVVVVDVVVVWLLDNEALWKVEVQVVVQFWCGSGTVS